MVDDASMAIRSQPHRRYKHSLDGASLVVHFAIGESIYLMTNILLYIMCSTISAIKIISMIFKVPSAFCLNIYISKTSTEGTFINNYFPHSCRFTPTLQ